MREKNITSFIRYFSVLVLIAAMALTLFSCGEKANTETSATGDETSAVSGTEENETANTITISVTVIDDTGNSETHEIKTSCSLLGNALTEAGLIEGEAGPYGLYIKKVCGILADYDVNGAYWALSKDGEYLMSGADMTPISDGDSFELTYTKG